VLLFPGGAREVFKRKGEEYRLFWPYICVYMYACIYTYACVLPCTLFTNLGATRLCFYFRAARVKFSNGRGRSTDSSSHIYMYMYICIYTYACVLPSTLFANLGATRLYYCFRAVRVKFSNGRGRSTASSGHIYMYICMYVYIRMPVCYPAPFLQI